MMQYLTKALLAACWFMLLTFPVMGIKLNSVDQTVEWQFDRVILLGVAIFFLSMLWNWCFSRKARGIPLIRLPEGLGRGLHRLVTLPGRSTATRLTSLGLLLAVMIVMPLVSSFYQTNIMISAMLYVILALGLNIAVGIAGQLVLGYVAFYAVGAYSYALLNQAFGLGFWACLPVGGFMAIVFGLALGFPVLRLRGDYLAIVTLGFRRHQEHPRPLLLRPGAGDRRQHHLHLLSGAAGRDPDHHRHQPPQELPCGACPAGPARRRDRL